MIASVSSETIDPELLWDDENLNDEVHSTDSETLKENGTNTTDTILNGIKSLQKT
jgi:uncharacterized paraquat-inducible protein A